MTQGFLSRSVLAVSIIAISYPFLCQAQTPALGNEPGEIKSSNLSGSLEVRQGECNYSVKLKENQTITYNTPDIIIYENTLPIDSKSIPYMWQPETYSGYDWNFKNPGRRNLRWLGLICESAENLPFLNTNKSELTFGSDEIIGSNRFKCPAKLFDGKFVLSEEVSSDKNYTIENISQNNWSGFIVFHRSKPKNTYDQMRFCLLHDNVVLIGTTENAQPAPALDEQFRKMTLDFVNSIKFY
jgi:hypothetical protein